MRHHARWALVAVIMTMLSLGLTKAAGASSGAGSSPRVYWDQNEEEDWLVHPGLQQSQPLVPAWDANGQACLFPDGSGRFTTAYNPTTNDQKGNPGLTKPLMLPPVGEVVWDQHGNFTGQTMAVPGSYLGGDIPGNTQNPRDGSFNNNGTYVGCAFGKNGNFFDGDLGNAQGTVPPQDSGRLIEWFAATNYTTYCILAGPTKGGTGPHHIDGSGGLRQPGTMASDSAGDILVPVLGVASSLNGEVLKFDAATLPTSDTQCPASNGNMPLTPAHASVFINTTLFLQPTPQGIARDPVCKCWAVSSVLLGNAVAWYTDSGVLNLTRVPVPGLPPPPTPITVGNTLLGYSPQGLAFTPDGTLYFADLHVVCVSPPTESHPMIGLGCGPASLQGQVMKVTFSAGVPSLPAAVNTQKLDFPVSVTVCDPATYAHCPAPPGF